MQGTLSDPLTGATAVLDARARHRLFLELPADCAASLLPSLQAALPPTVLSSQHLPDESTATPFLIDVDARVAAPAAYALIRGGADWASKACEPVSVVPLTPEDEARFEAGARTSEREGSFWVVSLRLQGRLEKRTLCTPPHPFPRAPSSGGGGCHAQGPV